MTVIISVSPDCSWVTGLICIPQGKQQELRGRSAVNRDCVMWRQLFQKDHTHKPSEKRKAGADCNKKFKKQYLKGEGFFSFLKYCWKFKQKWNLNQLCIKDHSFQFQYLGLLVSIPYLIKSPRNYKSR